MKQPKKTCSICEQERPADEIMHSKSLMGEMCYECPTCPKCTNVLMDCTCGRLRKFLNRRRHAKTKG